MPEIYQYILGSSPSSEGDDGFRFQRVDIQCGMGMLTPRFRSFDIIRYRPSSGDFHYRSVRVVRRDTIVGVMTMHEGVRSSLCQNDQGRLLHAYACDYIRSDRRGFGIEVQGARPGPGKRLCCRGPFSDELRILLLAASAGAGNDYDSYGASDWVSIEYRYTA